MQGSFPAPADFPAPAPYPAPTPDPNQYGLMPWQQQTSGLYAPQANVIEAPQAPVGSSYLAQLKMAADVSTVQGADMTLPEAQQQTDRALARIAQVNPALAQQLTLQRGDVPEEDDRGFFDKVMGVFSASPIGKALEFISRPARIIPEILLDGDESVWKNIGDAMTGKSTASMGDVLAKYDILQGDGIFSAVARGVTSFALDIAVDPTTYLTMGLGAVGRAGATRFAAKVGLEAKLVQTTEGMSIIDDIVKTAGDDILKLGADATLEQGRSAAMDYLWRTLTSKASSRAKLGKLGSIADDLSVVHGDFLGGPLSMALKDSQQAALKTALGAADEAHKLVGKFGLRGLSPKLAEHLGIPLDEMHGVLGGLQKAGRFGSREAYMEAKFAGALEGGWRFALPGARLITPAIWGTGRLDFSIARRFTAGLSGQTRIMAAVERRGLDPALAKKALEIATTKGWHGIENEVPEVAALFGGVGGRLGTAFATASHQIGKITENLGSAKLVRGGGLGDALAADSRKVQKIIQQKLVTEAYDVGRGHADDPRYIDDLIANKSKLDVAGGLSKDPDARLTQPMMQRTIHQLDKTAIEATGDELITIKTTELFPTLQAQEMGADAWYDLLDDTLRIENPKNLEARLAQNARRRAAAKAIEEQMALHPEIGLAARGYRIVTDQTLGIFNEMGGNAAKSSVRTAARAIIHPGNRADIETGHALQHGKNYNLADQALDAENLGKGLGEMHITDGPEGRGTVFVQGEAPPMPEPEPPAPGVFPGRTERAIPDKTPSGPGFEPAAPLEGDSAGYVYHITPRENFDSIQEGGLTPQQTTYGIPEDQIPPEMRGGRVFVADSIDRAKALAQGGGDFVALRMKAGAVGDATPETLFTGSSFGRRGISVDDLEYQAADGTWHALKKSEPVPVPTGPTRREFTPQVKNPIVVNKDNPGGVMKNAAGETKTTVPSTTDVGISPWDEINTAADNAMEMLNEAWDKAIPRMKASPRFRAADKEVRDLLRRMGYDPEGMSDEMARVILENQDSIRSRLISGFAQERGYDGVIVIEKGKQRVTVFNPKEGKAPVWELDGNAPFMRPDQGYFHRRIGSQIQERLKGQTVGGARRKPAEWNAAFERETKDMTFEEAEEHIRGQLADMGIKVAPEQQIFDRNVPSNLNAYVDGMSKEISNSFLGREARRIQALGLADSPFVGHYVGPRYEGVPSAAYLNTGDWLRRQSEKLFKFSQQAAKIQAKAAKSAMPEVRRLEKVTAELNERIHGAIDVEVEKLEKKLFKGIVTEEEVEQATTLLTPEAVRPGLAKQLRAREAELDTIRRQIDNGMNLEKEIGDEFNRIMHDSQARVAEPKVALQVGSPDRAGMMALEVKGLEGMYMPAPMAEEFNRAARGYKHLSDFQKTYRRYLSLWKENATWVMPGFHIRNAMGGFFNNWLGGVQFSDYVEIRRAARARKEIEEGLKPNWSEKPLSREFIRDHGLGEYYVGLEPTYADLASLMTHNGINTMNTRSFGEVLTTAERTDMEMAKPSRTLWSLPDVIAGRRTAVGGAGRFAEKKLRKTGEMTENIMRGAAFLQGMKQTGGDMMGAHAFVMMRHGDYGDLTDWEYGLIRDVIPFYKWMRTNTPLQIHQLFERPAHLMATLHAKEAGFEVSGVDFDEAKKKMPDWAMEGLSIPMPGSTEDAVNLFTLDLPMNDLFQGGGEFVSGLLPLMRPFLESYVTEKSFFTGAPIEGKPVKVGWVPGFMGKMLQSFNFGNVDEDGNYYIDDKLQNVLNVIPPVSRFRNWIYEEPARAHLRTGTIVSALAGVQVRSFGELDFRNDELDFYYSNVVPQLEHMRSMGYPLLSTDDLNNMYGASNNVLLAAGIDPRGGIQ